MITSYHQFELGIDRAGYTESSLAFSDASSLSQIATMEHEVNFWALQSKHVCSVL